MRLSRNIVVFGALAVIGAVLPASRTQAQFSVALSAILVDGEIDRTDREDLALGINAQDCASPDNVALRFVVTGSAATSVDLWRGQDNETCVEEDARQPDTRTCTPLGDSNPQIDSTDSTFDVSLNDFIEGSSACSNSGGITGQVFNLLVIATGNRQVVSELSGIDHFVLQGVSDGQSGGIRVDAVPPGQATITNSSPVTGNTSVGIEWNNGFNDVTADGVVYLVPIADCDAFVTTPGTGSTGDADAGNDAGTSIAVDAGVADAGTADAGSTGSDVSSGSDTTSTSNASGFVPGEIPPSGAEDFIAARTDDNVSNASLNLANAGLALGEEGLVFVAGSDEAGNVGPLSPPICAQRVNVVGLCDLLGDCPESSCSVHVPGSFGSAFGLFAIAVVGGGLFVRRRRRTSRCE